MVVHYQPLSLFARAGNTSGVDNQHHDDHKAHFAQQDDQDANFGNAKILMALFLEIALQE